MAIAQILKYASSVTRKGSCPDRFVEGIHKWRSAWDYKFELGETAISGRRLEIHGLVAIARRISCNSYWTGIRNQMATKWGVHLVRGSDTREPKDGEFVVDVKKLLPVRLREVFREKQIVKFVHEEGKEHRDFETEARASFSQAMTSLDKNKTKKKQMNRIFKNVWEEYYEGGGSRKVCSPSKKQKPTKRSKPGSATKKSDKTTNQASPNRIGCGNKSNMNMSPSKASEDVAEKGETMVASPTRGPRKRLLVPCPAVDKQVPYNKALGLSVLCCRFAFSGEHDCTAAYCTKCGNKIKQRNQTTEEDGRGEMHKAKKEQGVVGQGVVVQAGDWSAQ